VIHGTQPLVSVVIPSYNARPYVLHAIDSVLNQDYANAHLTIIEDGSTDGSAVAIREHLEARRPTKEIAFIVRENRGKGATLNQALELARGKYFCVLDADDVWEQGKLKRQVELMESLGPDAAGCFSDAAVIDEHGVVTDRLSRLYPYRGGDIFKDLLFMRFVPASPTNLFRRDAVVNVGGYDTGRLAEDFDLWIRLARNYRFHYLPSVLARYRIHGENQSIRRADTMFEDARTIVEEFLEVDETLAPYRREVEGRIAARSAAHSYNALRLREAKGQALSALLKSPFERLAWSVLTRSLLGRRVIRWLRSRRAEDRRLSARA
jgi:glycosyltransferase involved in cell wall biosynthesis